MRLMTCGPVVGLASSTTPCHHPRPAIKVDADVAKLVDAPDLGSGAARRGGSSPFIRTKLLKAVTIAKPLESTLGVFIFNLCKSGQ